MRTRISSGLLVVVLALGACAERAPEAPKDKYDPAQMDFRSPPASVTNERYTGAFAVGASLNPTARLIGLDPARVKDVRLDSTHKIIEIAPGVKYSAWTLGDQVPGPAIRARVGDRIRFTMTNRSDEPVPALRVTEAPMMHSMDFHSAMVSPQDKYRSIAPGQTITPEKMLEADADAQAMLKEWKNIPMPNQNLTDEEIVNYLKFFHWADEQREGTVKPMAGH